MLSGRLRFSLSTILISIVLLATLPALALSAVLLWRYASSERARAEQVLIEGARGLARSVDAQFATAEAVLLALRDSPFLAQGDLSAFESRLRRTAAESGRHFLLVEGDGQQLINTSLRPGAPSPKIDPAFWTQVFRTGDSHVTNVFHDPSTQRLQASLGVPVRRDGAIRWVLAAQLDVADFAPLLRDPGVPGDWIVSIVDRRGIHMIRSHMNEQFAGKSLVPILVNMMARGQSGPVRTTSLEGVSLISTVQYASRSRWAAAVGLPVASLEAPMRQSLAAMLIAGILIAGTALLLAFLVLRQVSRAMTSLTNAAQALARAEPVALPASNIREIDTVGTLLGNASRELSTLKAGLENQVAERTAALRRTNEELHGEILLRQESETQLLQVQKMEAIGKLTGGIAHDFNNMLAIVLGSLRLIERRLERGDSDVGKYIEAAVQGANRASTLTSRLLAFARQQPLAPQVIDANRLIAEMNEILRRTIRENIEIETVLFGGLWRIFADPPALESAIINLVANSRDAMPEGGKLTIETANAYLDESYAASVPDLKPGQYVMIAVADTGLGMPEDVIARVFDPFYTTKPLGEGTGLGLSQVHGFIKQSGGHVALYSEPEKGTTAKLYLPRYIGADVEEQRDRAKSAQFPRARDNEVVLVVEDDPGVRKLAVEMLQELGYITREASDAQTALDLLDREHDIRLIFTDVVLPGMNGRQLASEAQSRRPHLAVLFTTGYTRNAIVHHGRLDPDVHVIVKPYSIEALALKVRQLLPNTSTDAC